MILDWRTLDRTTVFPFLLLVIRYAISGFAGVFANLIVFSFLVKHYSVWYIYAALAGFVAAYMVTFTMHKYWTFKEKTTDRLVRQGWVYFCSAVAVLGVNTALLFFLVSVFRFGPILAQFLSLGVAAAVSFVFTAQVTFHRDANRLSQFTAQVRSSIVHYAATHLLWLLLLALVMTIVSSVRITYLPLTYTSDAISYIATADLLEGKTEVFYGERFLKPLAPAGMAVLSQGGLTTVQALVYEAVIGYFVMGFAVYLFGWALFRRRTHAFALALVIVTSYPIFRYGLDMYTETGIWAACFIALYGMVEWHTKPRTGYVWLTSLALLWGLLWKEYAVLIGLVFLTTILFHPTESWRKKLQVVLQSGCLILIPWFIWQWYVYTTFHYSYLDWLKIGSAATTSDYSYQYSPLAIIKSLFALLYLVWGLVLYGFWQWKHWPPLVRRFFYYLCIPSFGFLLWGYVSSRLFFSLVPLVAPLAVVGYFALPKYVWLRVGIILLILVVNSILAVLAFDPSVRAFLNALIYGS